MSYTLLKFVSFSGRGDVSFAPPLLLVCEGHYDRSGRSARKCDGKKGERKEAPPPSVEPLS